MNSNYYSICSKRTYHKKIKNWIIDNLSCREYDTTIRFYTTTRITNVSIRSHKKYECTEFFFNHCKVSSIILKNDNTGYFTSEYNQFKEDFYSFLKTFDRVSKIDNILM
jgi:hypothetical protein